MHKEIPDSVCPSNKKEWRLWLKENHLTKDFIWLIVHKKSAKNPTITWSESVDEALCFGWIDSVRKPIDNERFMQYFAKRKATSTWSKINKDKVASLIEQGLMYKAGLQCIETAKQNGSWTTLDEAENLIIPDDLEKAFKKNPDARDYYMSLSKSIRKSMLHWLAMAKRPETRQKRLKEIVEQALKKQKPKHMMISK